MDEAVLFYEVAGFTVNRYDDGFVFVQLNDQSVFDLDLVPGLNSDDNHAGCYIIVDDVDGWHRRLHSGGLNVTALDDMPWHMREFRLTDPSGNNIRIGRSSTSEGDVRVGGGDPTHEH